MVKLSKFQHAVLVNVCVMKVSDVEEDMTAAGRLAVLKLAACGYVHLTLCDGRTYVSASTNGKEAIGGMPVAADWLR
jgi:hypothetical protein